MPVRAAFSNDPVMSVYSRSTTINTLMNKTC